MGKNNNPEYKIGLFYLSGPLDDDDIFLIRSKLNESSINFVSVDKNGNITASIEDFTNIYSFVINSSLALSLISGVIASAAWESIKFVILYTFNKIRGSKYNKITRKGVEEKEVTFGIEIKINDAHYNFKFNGVSSDVVLSEALDKILFFLKSTKQQPKEMNKLTTQGLPNYIVTYDEKSSMWIVRNTNEIIQEMIEKSK